MALTPGDILDVLGNDHLMDGCGSLTRIRVCLTHLVAMIEAYVANGEITLNF